MFNVVLYEPEIPSNTGNVGRLCVAAGATLHVVGRPAFHLDDKAVSGDKTSIAALDALTRDPDSEVAQESLRALRSLKTRIE